MDKADSPRGMPSCTSLLHIAHALIAQPLLPHQAEAMPPMRLVVITHRVMWLLWGLTRSKLAMQFDWCGL